MQFSTLLKVAGVGALTSVGATVVGERRLLKRMAATPSPPGWAVPRWPEGTELMVPTDDGAQLVVASSGPTDGPVVVLVHGLTSRHHDWGPVAERLVATGHRVIGINQRGHGGSTVGSEGFGAARQGADVGQVLSALDLRDVTLVGHSMGGMAALALLTICPEQGADRVGRLVGVATLADAKGPDRQFGMRLGNRPTYRKVAEHPVHGTALARFVFGTTPSSEMVEQALASYQACPQATRIGAAMGMLEYDVRELLGAISVPTTVICGNRDLLTPLGENRAIADAIPGAEFLLVPGAGHLVIWEAADVVADTIASTVTAEAESPAR